MYYTKEQPTSGSFVSVWRYADCLFSSDYKYFADVLYVYDTVACDYIESQYPLAEHVSTDVLYITQEAPKYTEMV